MDFKPFADDAASLGVGGLTIENGTDKLSLYGTLDLRRDKAGLADARALAAVLAHAVAVLEAAHDLPDAAPVPAGPRTVRNPFA